MEEKYDVARENAYRLRDVFGKNNFFLEIQDQGLEIEKGVNRELVRLSKETGIPLIATNDCHYLHHEDAHAQEVLLCIQTGKTMSDTHRMKFATDQFYFKSAAEMAQRLSRSPRRAQPDGGCRASLQRQSRAHSESVSGIQSARGTYRRKLFRESRARRICDAGANPRAAGAAGHAAQSAFGV